MHSISRFDEQEANPMPGLRNAVTGEIERNYIRIARNSDVIEFLSSGEICQLTASEWPEVTQPRQLLPASTIHEASTEGALQ
jgi:GMP synthase PP-ATPase subunit